MTCIVGIIENGLVVMGADSCASDEESQTFTIAKNTKIFRKNEIIIGCADSFRVINVIRYIFKPPPIKGSNFEYIVSSFIPELQKTLEIQKLDISSDDLGLHLLVGIKDEIFEIHNNFSVVITPSYGAAIGSGEVVAKGSLYTTRNMNMKASQRVLMALEAAEANILSVRAPFDILEN